MENGELLVKPGNVYKLMIVLRLLFLLHIFSVMLFFWINSTCLMKAGWSQANLENRTADVEVRSQTCWNYHNKLHDSAPHGPGKSWYSTPPERWQLQTWDLNWRCQSNQSYLGNGDRSQGSYTIVKLGSRRTRLLWLVFLLQPKSGWHRRKMDCIGSLILCLTQMHDGRAVQGAQLTDISQQHSKRSWLSAESSQSIAEKTHCFAYAEQLFCWKV